MYARNFIFTLVCLSLYGTVFGQFKQITFRPSPPLVKEQIKLKLPFGHNESHQEQAEAAYNRPLTPLALKSFHNGLRAGLMRSNGKPAYIEGRLRNTATRNESDASRALEYLTEAAPILGINDPEAQFSVARTEQDDLGMTHIRMYQHYQNITVYGSEIILHGDKDGIHFLNGHYEKLTYQGSTTPALQTADILNKVFEDLGPAPVYQRSIREVGTMAPVTKLIIYPLENSQILAYHITAYKNIIERWEYIVDATSGHVVRKFQSICKFHNHQHGQACSSTSQDPEILDGKATANAIDLFNVSRLINTYQVGNKFYLIDGSRDIFSSSPADLPNDPKGVIWTIDAFNTSPATNNFNYDHVTSTNNIWSSKTAVSSHYNGGKAFEYFRNVHNRKSINGTGGNIISLINVADEDGSSLGNAFWNGQAMFYGNGDNAFQPLARGLDVAGHEMAHGVIQSTANLEYQDESGALNESFADIFGAMIDREDWKIGEDVVKTNAFPSGALRNMEDPHNGAATNDFSRGWQPRHYNERYTGSEDNGGVHINSGIPNFAFFKTATAIGKDKAEKIFYRALANYLTKSSRFVDCRVAAIKAAGDLFGTSEVNAVKKAFDEVGILGDQAGDYENDAPVNPGQEFLLTTGADNNGLFIHNENGVQLAQITFKEILSKPSITDDGSIIVYIGGDQKLYYAEIDWDAGSFKADQLLDASPVWRAVAISKDGNRLAGLFQEKINEIFVFDFPTQTERVFELYNPTFTQGISTGDVNYADAMEFDLSGEYLMYDAENELKSNTAGTIQYWDIGFLNVWDKQNDEFAEGDIDKLFTSLPEGVSVGNPTFAKNSPYIIAFDYLDDQDNLYLLAANIETGKVSEVFQNNTLSYPSYGIKDNKISFDNDGSTAKNIALAPVTASKIDPAANPFLIVLNKRWPVWFSNGTRVLSDVTSLTKTSASYRLRQNPADDYLEVICTENAGKIKLAKIADVTGRFVRTFEHNAPVNHAGYHIQDLAPGIYFLHLADGESGATLKFVKGH